MANSSSERASASEPRERSGAGVPARERVGESGGRSPSVTIDKRLLILWLAVSFVVWNGVYDMRMHDAAQRYLLDAALAQAGLGGGVDMRIVMHRGLVDAIAFSTAWALGVLLAGLATMEAYRRAFRPKTDATRPHPAHVPHPAHRE